MYIYACVFVYQEEDEDEDETKTKYTYEEKEVSQVTQRHTLLISHLFYTHRVSLFITHSLTVTAGGGRGDGRAHAEEGQGEGQAAARIVLRQRAGRATHGYVPYYVCM